MNNNKDAEKNALDKLDQELNKNSTNSIEDQVNSLGKAEESAYSEPKGLGKVERFDHAAQDVKETEKKFGWHRLHAENFPSIGRYYETDIKVVIKAATVNEIKHFSIIDESDPYSVDDAITDLLKICVKVSYDNRQGSWKDIKEEDKVYIVLAIRELTFAEDENRISFEVKCSSCKAPNQMEIKNENFQRRELPERISKYYSEESRIFIIKSKTFGEIRMSPPSIGSMRIIAEYIKNLSQAGEDIKEYMPFLKVLPYLSPDWRGLSIPKINNLKMDFLRWDKKQFLLYTQLSEKLQVGVKEKMLKKCDSCAEPIEAEIQLPTGIKGLFVEEGILDDELE